MTETATRPAEPPADPSSTDLTVADPAAEVAAEGAAEDGAEEATPPRPRRRVPWPAARIRVRRRPAVLGAVAVVLAAGVAFTASQVFAADARQQREDDVIAVARQSVVNLLTINAGDTDTALRRLEDGATGEFKQQLVAQGDQFTSIVHDAKVDATGTISESGIRTLTADSATVLVSAVGLVKNTLSPDGQPRQYRMALDLTRDPDSGRWLVAKLEFAA